MTDDKTDKMEDHGKNNDDNGMILELPEDISERADAFHENYGFLFVGYEPRYCWWEVD